MMAKKMKKLFSLILAMSMVMSLVSVMASAAQEGVGATKTSEKIEGTRYQVEVSVPGKDGDNRHDEVILMVDGSYSLDGEWPAMKEAINTIAETVLNGSGNTKLTLMAFGMGDNVVIQHAEEASEVASVLGSLPGSLLYGRSSTNCEAGFTGVANYITNHDETLKDVHVIYISDGNINTDEHEEVFYFSESPWNKKFTLAGSLVGALEAEVEVMTYYEEVKASQAFVEVFGADVDLASLAAEINSIVLGRYSEKNPIPVSVNEESELYAKVLEWADKVYTYVFAAAGMDARVACPVSDAERAFVAYDEANGTYIQEAFYYPLMGRGYPDATNRAKAAADALAAMEEVKSMYVVDYDSKSEWMDSGITSEKSTFVKSDGIGGLCDALAAALAELSKTPFNDVVVSDYMSKWVNLDPSTLAIVDNRTNTTIWTASDGWLINENRPTAQEIPVVAELVDPADYEAGGADVIGNASGDIYKLTWYVKDGAMVRSDNYTLQYEVTVDTIEPGFSYNQNYPSNGNTDLLYTDENGVDQSVVVTVPEVRADMVVRPPVVVDPPVVTPPADDTDDTDDTTGEEIPDENVPMEDAPVVEDEEIGDNDTPLADAPAEDEIFDEDVPLADVPATGDMTALWMAASAISAAGLFFVGKKSKDEE